MTAARQHWPNEEFDYDRTRLVPLRKLPIDFAAIAKESGLKRGKLARSTTFNCWGVFNEHGDEGADFAVITPPVMQAGETELRICGRWWTFFGPDRAYLASLGKEKAVKGDAVPASRPRAWYED